MTIGIIGMGLIGGSMALSLRQADFGKKIVGMDQSPQTASRALELRLVEEIVSLETLILNTELIILAIPVDGIKKLLPKLLDQIPDKSVVFDIGSTKGEICQAVAGHPKRNRFVATHPIAGTEHSGPEAAFAGLFEGKTAIICQAEYSAPDALRAVEEIYARLRMPLIRMDPETHDLHLAYISHLSHVLSFGLARIVMDIEKDEQNILHLAGSGFASAVRLAKSRPETWLPIFQSNKTNLLEAVEAYINQLNAFRTLLREDDSKAVHRYMREANDIRKILKE